MVICIRVRTVGSVCACVPYGLVYNFNSNYLPMYEQTLLLLLLLLLLCIIGQKEDRVL